MTEKKTAIGQGADEPIVRRKLSEQVFDRLRHMVASGELAPGDAMYSERELMERFGVGRPAIREALQSLASKGLITISHGERSRVNRLTPGMAFGQMDEIARLLLSTEPDNLDHLKELRRLLEVATVRKVAPICTPEDISDLRGLVSTQRGHLGDASGFIQTDIAFHARLAEATGNPLIKAVTEAMLTWLFDYHAPMLRWSGREETTLSEHESIVDFLEKRDADTAAEMMAGHLDRSEPLYRHLGNNKSA